MNSRQSVLRDLVVGLVMAGLMTAVMHAGARAGGVEVSKGEFATGITLKHTQPSYMVRLLGLYTDENILNGKMAGWERVDGSPGLAVNGIDSIGFCERERTLGVRGSKEGIDELKSLVGKMDVEPEMVTMKAEFYSVSPDFLGQIGRLGVTAPAVKDDGFMMAFAKAPVLSDIKARLSDLRSSEILATGISNWPIHARLGSVATKADAPVSDAGAGIEFTTTPVVNADKSITLRVGIKEWDAINPPQPQSRQVRINGRISSGESLILLGGSKADGKKRLIIITARLFN